MKKRFNLRTGSRVLEEVDSAVNGKVRVLQSLAWGNHIQAGNLTQSGGVVFDVWKYSLKRVNSKEVDVGECLILGLGGGSCARLVRRFWPESEITGVEIDPVMVDLGMKYLGLADLSVEVKVEDALEFCEKQIKGNNKFDLVLVDLYVGENIPQKFETEEFIEKTKSVLTEGGIAVYNRLYYDEKRSQAVRFSKKLEENYKTVEPVYPQANVMFVCFD
ncbi:MAG: fused MFS/spermidine synthase [Candidatus Woesebacteria bacterium]|jgi:spermidine synthase